MGRTSGGVEIRAASIRLNFTLEGKRERQTLMLNGKPMPPTPANVKYAYRLIAEIVDRIRLGTFSLVEYFPTAGAPSTLTVGGWLDTWLAAQRIESSTKDGYESAIRFWKAAACDKNQNPLGPTPLRRLKLSHILTAIAGRPDLSGKTVNNYVSVMRKALDLAVSDNLLTDNPAANVPRAKHQKPPPDPFSRDESEKIIDEAERAYPGQVHNLIEFWFWTGLRTSEIFGLQWLNVDLQNGTILVAEALVRGEHKDRTKTAVARTVRLNSRAIAALTRQRSFTQIAGAAIFHDPRYSTRWEDERAFRRSFWTPILKRLGIRYRRPYNMRHSYATAMLMAGMTPAFCAKQLGHSIEMFLTTYAKWMDGEQNALEMARLESTLLSPSCPPQSKTGA
ncbi:site-specific integrase [Burkholderia sp. Bp9004]|uniref:site-specific integrase n=1 Tax=Burkholderia sp. Bp9004 TaxID=2184559 RepID=UPI000F600CCC|nr:site-specific integrase [Burkholderia sp. Bp9004]RQZ60947.1 site-specific integrase [Burkholderia sp. Bp9004]